MSEEEGEMAALLGNNDDFALTKSYDLMVKQAKAIFNRKEQNTASNFFSSAVIFMIGSTAGVPYFKLARDYAGSKIIFGYILGVCTLCGEAAISIWAYFNLIDAIKARRIAVAKQRNSSIMRLASFYFVVLLFTLMAQIPNTYISYKYNNDDDKIIYMIITFLNDFGLRFYAVEQFMSKLLGYFLRKCQSYGDSNNFLEQDQLVANYMAQLDKYEGRLVSDTANPDELYGGDFDLRPILHEFWGLEDRIVKSKPSWYKIFVIICIIISYLFPTAILGYQIKETLEFSSKFGILGQIFIPILSIVPLIYLEYAVIHRRVALMIDHTVGRLLGYVQPALTYKYFPRRTVFGSLLISIIGALCFGPRAEITKKNFSGAWGNAALFLIIVGAVIFETNALIDVWDRINKWISKSSKNSSFDHKQARIDMIKLIRMILVYSKPKLTKKFIYYATPNNQHDALRIPISNESCINMKRGCSKCCALFTSNNYPINDPSYELVEQFNP